MDVVSFYTGEGAYKDFADKLRRSCEKLGITPHIEKLDSTGVWAHNNSKKPSFVLRKLMELKRPIIWCDADCEVIEFPTRLDNPKFDLGVYNWAADPDGGTLDPDCKLLQASSGVLLLNYTSPMLQLAHQWVAAATKHPQIPDDTVLDQVYMGWRGAKLRHFWLPREYNRMDLRWPHIKPVINHVYRDGAIFTGAQTLEKDPYLGTLPDAPLYVDPNNPGSPKA